MNDNPVRIDYYRWAGSFGPFKVKIPCGECTLTADIIQDVLKKELQSIPTVVNRFDWLDVWYKPLLHGGWHAPIVCVNDEVISQGVALNRGVLIEKVITAHAKATPVTGNHVFGKEGCPYCRDAKRMLAEANIDYVYHDVVSEPVALYTMLARAKPHIPARTPITVPQIWLDGEYIGGSEQLAQKFAKK